MAKGKAPGDWRIPKFVFYVVFIGLLILIGFTYVKQQRLNNTHNDLLEQQNIAQGQYNTAKNDENTIKYVVSPNGEISQHGLDLISTGNEVLKLGTTFMSPAQYKSNVQKAKQLVWDSTMFEKNAFFGQRKDYFEWANPIKSQTQEVDTYQLNDNQFLSIVRYATYSNRTDLVYIDQLHSSYKAFLFSGSNGKILKMHEINNFYSPTGHQ